MTFPAATVLCEVQQTLQAALPTSLDDSSSSQRESQSENRRPGVQTKKQSKSAPRVVVYTKQAITPRAVQTLGALFASKGTLKSRRKQLQTLWSSPPATLVLLTLVTVGALLVHPESYLWWLLQCITWSGLVTTILTSLFFLCLVGIVYLVRHTALQRRRSRAKFNKHARGGGKKKKKSKATSGRMRVRDRPDRLEDLSASAAPHLPPSPLPTVNPKASSLSPPPTPVVDFVSPTKPANTSVSTSSSSTTLPAANASPHSTAQRLSAVPCRSPTPIPPSFSPRIRSITWDGSPPAQEPTQDEPARARCQSSDDAWITDAFLPSLSHDNPFHEELMEHQLRELGGRVVGSVLEEELTPWESTL